MKLQDYILSHKEAIMQEWENYARTVLPDANMDSKALRNHISYLLEFVAKDMCAAQTNSEQTDKSRGLGTKEEGKENSAAEMHAAIRLEEGFDIIQMTSEFRALRASVIKLWNRERNKEGTQTDDGCEDMIRFNESIDQMQMEALVRYNKSLNHARALFLGTLVHDMRNPMGAISNSLEILKTINNLDDTQKKLVDIIERSSKNVTKLVSDLIDATRARLKGIQISREPMDIGVAARQAASEAEMSSHRGPVTVETEGNLDGEWDGARINQVLSNLVGNALQHGADGSAVKVIAKGERDDVVLSVHNAGKPIPAKEIPTIFDPLSRGMDAAQQKSEGTSLGLGLFIAKEIVSAHGGKIEVTSTEEGGTTFTARLPRRSEPTHTLS